MNIKKKTSVVIRNIKFMIPLFFRKSKITLFVMLLSAILYSLSNIIGLILPSMILDELIGDKNVNIIILYVAILVISTFLINSLNNIFNHITSYYARKMDIEIDKMFSEKIMNVDYYNLEDPSFVDKMNMAKKGMNNYSNGVYAFIYSLSNIISSFITLLGVIGIVIYSKQYIVMILTVIAIITNTIMYKKIQNNNQEFRNYFVRTDRKLWYYNMSIGYFRNQKDLRINRGDKLILDTTNDINKKAFKEYGKLTKKNIILDSLDSLIYFITTNFLTILALGYNFIQGLIDIPTFQLLFSSMNILDNAVANIIYSVNDYVKACEYQNDYIDIIEMKNTLKDGKIKLEKIESIEFDNVSFKYPRTDKFILKNVSFRIDNKQKVSLVGLNGAGKTTIIKLICRFYSLDEGKILVNGIDINEYEYESYMSLISVVFQDFLIISFKVKSNIAITDDNQEKLYDCLRRSEALDKVLSLPDKENTYINKWFDKTGVEFSGGEMQKFAIARCLYKDSDFVVLDEPTSALDPASEAKIYYDFNEVVGKKLTLFISHRLSSCIFSNRILVLDGERIVEEGTHKELMSNKEGLYYKMFTSQASYYQDN